MKSIFVTILAIGSFTLSFAQPANVITELPHGIHLFPDSIRLEFPDQSTVMVFQLKDPHTAGDRIDRFFKSLPQLLHFVQQGVADLKTPHHVIVREQASDQRTMTIVFSPEKSTRIDMNDKDITQL